MLGHQDLARQVAAQVFRTTLALPGFAHLDLETAAGVGGTLSGLVEELGRELAEVYRQDFGRALELTPQGSFDQQVTTEAHRDGGPDDSILLLGYEPTTVASRLLILDFSRAAAERGQTPAEFLARFNPTSAVGRQELEGHVTELAGFDPDHAHLVVINNGNRALEQAHTGMLGVLHQGIVPRPDPTSRRIIHSWMLAAEG
jgi:hypothetical protein